MGDPDEYCWDKTNDEKYEIKEPEAKKKKMEEWVDILLTNL